ncbi:MAG: hypothetical protein QW166_01535 [Candidatus Bathyarchaeia archaeon]
MQNCTYAKTDNKSLLNCIKGDSHIGLCQTPCPYVKQLRPQLATYSYIVGCGVSAAFSPKQARKKLRSTTFRYSYIVIEAEEVAFYEW